MLSWRDSGLLSFVDERILMLNDPAPSEVALGLKHGFEVLLPSDIQKRIGPQMPRQVKREVLTIGAAFAAACAVSTSTHVLFLEKDFAVAPGRHWTTSRRSSPPRSSRQKGRRRR